MNIWACTCHTCDSNMLEETWIIISMNPYLFIYVSQKSNVKLSSTCPDYICNNKFHYRFHELKKSILGFEIQVNSGHFITMLIWRLVCQKHISSTGTRNHIQQNLWDVIICPCPWYMLMAHKLSYTRRWYRIASNIDPTKSEYESTHYY